MKKFFLSLALLLAFTSIGLGQGSGPITVKEVDGAPVCNNCRTFVFPNGSLTVSGNKVTVASGGGGGGSPGGSNTQVQYNAAGSFGGVAGFTFNGTSTINLGVAGTSVGAIGFRNATSGTITLQPVTGALGTVTLSLPAVTDTLVGLAATQALTNKTINGLTISTTTGTLTITNGKTASFSNTLTFTGTDSSSVAFGAGGTVAYVGTANSWTAGVKQTFSPNGTTAGVNVGSVAGDPSAPANGDLWYDSTANELTARINGANVALGAGGGGGITIGTTTITSGTNTRVLFNNSGVVGEYVITGTGNAVLSASPTLTGTVDAAAATFSNTVSLTSTTAANNKITQGAAINIGTTSTDGIILQNTTAAAAGAQQYSPRLRLTGQGWKTNATAASQTVDWIMENQPVQGAANALSTFALRSQINGGGYVNQLQITSGSLFTIGNTSVQAVAINAIGTGNFSSGFTQFGNLNNNAMFAMVYPSGVWAMEMGSGYGVKGHIGLVASTTDALEIGSGMGSTSPFNLTKSYLKFDTSNVRLMTDVSFVIGSAGSIGTSGTNTLGITNGTAPSSRPADEFQFYAADYAAGDSRANILSENNATPVTIGNHSVLTGYQHLTKTTDYTVVTADSNAFFDNIGAGAGVTFTLPTPTASPSLKYTFCRVANQTVTVDIGGSVTIRSGASVTTSGGNVTLDAVGSCLTIYSISSTEWYASASVGTLTFN